MCYLMVHLTHFIYCKRQLGEPERKPAAYMGYSFCLETRVLLYAPSHRHTMDSTYHGLCYTSRGK